MANTTGSYNTALGSSALSGNTTGGTNIGIGYQAGSAITTGSNNIMIGATGVGGDTATIRLGTAGTQTATYVAGINGVTVTGGSMVVVDSLGRLGTQNTNTALNTAVGKNALQANAAGTQNSAFGYESLKTNYSGFNNTAVGYQALTTNYGGTNNTASGNMALKSNTSGLDNTASGSEAMKANTTGSSNTAFGRQALSANVGGTFSSAFGAGALQNSNSPVLGANSAFGYHSLYGNITGQLNTAVGLSALGTGGTGNQNTAVGNEALILNTGDSNTAVGDSALSSNTSGAYNIALGFYAGENLTTGSHNIMIGNSGLAGESGVIRIGDNNQTSTVIAGISGVTIPAGAQVYVASDGTLGTVTSSQRFKRDIHDMGSVSDVLLQLRPVTFRYKQELDPKGTQQFGLIAEEVAKVAPDLLVLDAAGKIQSVRYDAVNAMLLNEFQKEHATVEKQGRVIASQQDEIAQLKARLDALEGLVRSRTEGK